MADRLRTASGVLELRSTQYYSQDLGNDQSHTESGSVLDVELSNCYKETRLPACSLTPSAGAMYIIEEQLYGYDASDPLREPKTLNMLAVPALLQNGITEAAVRSRDLYQPPEPTEAPPTSAFAWTDLT